MEKLLDVIKIELDKKQNVSKINNLFSDFFYYEKIYLCIIFLLLIILTFSSIFNSYFIFKYLLSSPPKITIPSST